MPERKGVTPLLRTLPPKAPAGKFTDDDGIVGWAYERPGGGRSFAFTGCHIHASFGLDGFRFAHAARYLGEEFLVVGGLCALGGLARLARLNRRLLVGLAAWVVPSALLAILFRIEGQEDFWLVASWLPLHLASAVFLADLTRAIDNGVTQEEITEVITHMAFYAGWPAAMSAAQVAYNVLVEDNKAG